MIVENNNQHKGKLPFGLKVVLNLLAMCGIGILLIWLSTYWLDVWTHHGDSIVVPKVKGMHFDKARDLLESQDFEVVLQDSVYEDGAAPGAVIEQNPKDSTNVKTGRTIYLTINAFYPRTVMLPVLTDISVRQATTILEGYGIKNVTIKEVPSEYEDLVFAALYKGKRLKPGTRVPLTAQITLEVGVALQYEDMRTDTLKTSSDESAETSATPSADVPALPATEPAVSEPAPASTNIEEPDMFD